MSDLREKIRTGPVRLRLIEDGKHCWRSQRTGSPTGATGRPELHLIDCRPDLFERLASARSAPLWNRLGAAARHSLQRLLQKLRPESPGDNDNGKICG